MTDKKPNPDYMTDAEGRLVPISSVKPEDKLENDFVLGLFERAHQLNRELAKFKDVSFGEIDAFLELIAEKYKVKRAGKKGNVTFTSFDGKYQIKVANSDFIVFGPQLQVAKTLLDDFIKDEAAGISDDLRTFIFSAFRVDKEGQVNRAAILGLRRYDIQAEKWRQAMLAINDSIRISSTKRYVRFYYRPDADRDFVPVSLDFASI